MELVIVVVVLGILSAVAFVYGVSPMELSVPSQAKKIASDIRQVQMLAYTTGTPQCVNIVPGTTDCGTTISCPTCSISTLPEIYGGMMLTAIASPNGIRFNTLGEPTNLAVAATYRLATPESQIDISVAPETGFTNTP